MRILNFIINYWIEISVVLNIIHILGRAVSKSTSFTWDETFFKKMGILIEVVFGIDNMKENRKQNNFKYTNKLEQIDCCKNCQILKKNKGQNEI